MELLYLMAFMVPFSNNFKTKHVTFQMKLILNKNVSKDNE